MLRILPELNAARPQSFYAKTKVVFDSRSSMSIRSFHTWQNSILPSHSQQLVHAWLLTNSYWNQPVLLPDTPDDMTADCWMCQNQHNRQIEHRDQGDSQIMSATQFAQSFAAMRQLSL